MEQQRSIPLRLDHFEAVRFHGLAEKRDMCSYWRV